MYLIFRRDLYFKKFQCKKCSFLLREIQTKDKYGPHAGTETTPGLDHVKISLLLNFHKQKL